MKKLIFALCVTLLGVSCYAQKVVTWSEPSVLNNNRCGDGFFNLALDITKVEMTKEETRIHMLISQRGEYWFRFCKETYLQAGGVKYPLVSAEGITLDEQLYTDKTTNQCTAVFHFKPLPLKTKSFDFIEGDGPGAFQLKGIMSAEERQNYFFPSYWRNEETGNWDIAFFEDFVVYDCKFWDYKTKPATTQNVGNASFTITNGTEELQISISKSKKGLHTIKIGNETHEYSMITTRFMPDYPHKDTRTDFVDTGYKDGTVTITGWIKDMPEHYKGEKTFSFGYEDFFSDKQVENYANLDSMGRFTIRIPVSNSTEFFCDWSRCFVRMPFESGKTYFMIYDFKEGRRLFMGYDARLQNELFKFPLDWNMARIDELREKTYEQYIPKVDSLMKAQYKYIDDLCTEHPNLSTRFNLYRKGNTFSQQAREFGQSKFYSETRAFTEEASKYAYDTFWTNMIKPYTLHRDIRVFIRDYVDEVSRNNSSSFSYNVRDYIDEIAGSEEERQTLILWDKMLIDAHKIIDAEPEIEKKQKLADEINEKNAKLISKVDAILQGTKANRVLRGKLLIHSCRSTKHLLDSLGADNIVADAYLSQLVYNRIDNERKSLSLDVLDSIRPMITNQNVLDRITELNNSYREIENRDFDSSSLKSNDSLKDISEGEALLNKILEPFKGKIVLMDIWGTWCSPCKEALSHSKEEYARLKDYDIVYLYLANRSPKDSWETVIKQYEVTGDNVVHYNLPAEQQSAIERHLKVTAFPTYKLVDRNGKILNVNADPRNLDALETLLKRL